MKLSIFVTLLSAARIQNASCFGVAPVSSRRALVASPIFMSSEEEIKFSSKEEKEEVVGNLVADDEWTGFGMELTDAISMAISEDFKRNTREFIGKEEYKVGDISKEVDARVKDELAKLRGKEEYELGDLTMAIDVFSKKMVEDMTGKPYEFGDLSTEIDSKVKDATAKFCGKDDYEFGDLSSEIDRRVKDRVSEFLGNDDYEFGDISREIGNRRQAWAKEVLGENYEFGDLTKNAINNFTGKDDYEFGDVSKKLMGNLFGKKK